jgi:hypothetical protein
MEKEDVHQESCWAFKKVRYLSILILFIYLFIYFLFIYLFICNLDANRSFLTYRAVRAHEANYVPMRNYLSIIACMSNVSNTESIHLTAERIQECDEDIVKPTGKGFIKQYHHFTYVSAGVIKCQYIRGQGDYKQHTLNQQIGMVSESILRC